MDKHVQFEVHPAIMTMTDADRAAAARAAAAADDFDRAHRASTQPLARLADVYVEQLRRKEREMMAAEDDEGVIRVSRNAEAVQAAVRFYATGRTVLAVHKGRALSADGDTRVVLRYIDGLLGRVVTALATKNMKALSQFTRSGDSALEQLDKISNYPRDLEARTVKVDSIDLREEWTEYETNNNGITSLVQNPSLSRRDRLFVYLSCPILLFVLVAMACITSQFAAGFVKPDSFKSIQNKSSLPLPSLTICTAQPGIPHSRMVIQSYVRPDGMELYPDTGSDSTTVGRRFDASVEKFWHNPAQEQCEKSVGNSVLDLYKGGNLSTSCRACYRVGNKIPLHAHKPGFHSQVSVLVDVIAAQCLHGGLSTASSKLLQNSIQSSLSHSTKSLEKLGVLTRKDEGSIETIPDNSIAHLTGSQLCSAFYLGAFPALKGTKTTFTKYEYDEKKHEWLLSGKHTELKPGARTKSPAEVLTLQVGNNGSLSSISPGYHSFIKLTSIHSDNDEVFNGKRVSITQLGNPTPRENMGFWLPALISWGYDRLDVIKYESNTSYHFSRWLVDFTSYFALIIVLIQGLISFRRRSKAENFEQFALRRQRELFEEWERSIS